MLTSPRLLKTLAALTDARVRELRLGGVLQTSPVRESVCALDEIIGRCGGGATLASDGGTEPEVALLALVGWLSWEGEIAKN